MSAWAVGEHGKGPVRGPEHDSLSVRICTAFAITNDGEE